MTFGHCAGGADAADGRDGEAVDLAMVVAVVQVIRKTDYGANENACSCDSQDAGALGFIIVRWYCFYLQYTLHAAGPGLRQSGLRRQPGRRG